MTTNSNTQSDLQFAFGGNASRVMEKYFLRDAANAALSSKFRLYYLLRPLIPIWFRQKLQKSRVVGMTDVAENWHIPESFIEEFAAALKVDAIENPDLAVVHPWPKPYRMSVALTHDVETRAGVLLVDRLAKLEESYGFRSCWNFIPYKYKIEPELIEDLKQRGHEIGVHGYNHDGRLFSSKRVFNKRREPIKRAFESFGATGFRAPMVHRNLDWILSFGSDYDASCFDIDPFQAMPGGVGSAWPFMKKGMVELPYSLPQDHTLFIALAQNDISVWVRKLEFLRRWCGMGMLVTHPDYLDTESRLDLYRQFLEHLKSQSDTWFALPMEIAKWWRERDASSVESDLSIAGPASDRGQILKLAELVHGDDFKPENEPASSHAGLRKDGLSANAR